MSPQPATKKTKLLEESTTDSTSKPTRILLCGCGNAVQVLISYLGRESLKDTFEVNVLSLGHCERLIHGVPKDGYIRCINDMGPDTLGRASMISSDPAQVAPGCSVILFALPTDRHELYLKAMLPYIQEGTLIGSMPGEGGFDLCIRSVLGPTLAQKCTLFSLETLPWACRYEDFGKVVRVLGTKKDIDLCVYPPDQCTKVQDLLQSMIGPLPVVQAQPTSSFLGLTLMNPNGIAHPSILYGLLRDWDGTTPFEQPPLFYQGMDDYTAGILEAVSNEILLVKAQIQKRYPRVDLGLVRSIDEFFEEAYAEDIGDHSSLQRMFVSNKGYDGLVMPTQRVVDPDGREGYLPLFDHRYLTEDLPCGILVQKGIAELAGVPTPLMDRVIEWCEEKAPGQKEYLVNGKLCGKDVAYTKAPQRYGFTDLESFMTANGYA